jgi:hypothetical protein
MASLHRVLQGESVPHKSVPWRTLLAIKGNHCPGGIPRPFLLPTVVRCPLAWTEQMNNANHILLRQSEGGVCMQIGTRTPQPGLQHQV